MYMKKQKPKGKTPSLIGSSNGRPTKVAVKAKCECKRCHSDILVGDDCFEIPRTGSGFRTSKRFCKECFQKVLIQTQKDLDEIKQL